MTLHLNPLSANSQRARKLSSSLKQENLAPIDLHLAGGTALVLHAESFAAYGLTALLRERQCDATSVSLHRVTDGIFYEGNDPDVCFCGNLDDCSSKLLTMLRERFARTHIVLFDIDFEDDVVASEYATSCHRMGFDAVLPAYSSKHQLAQEIYEVFAHVAAAQELRAQGLYPDKKQAI